MILGAPSLLSVKCLISFLFNILLESTVTSVFPVTILEDLPSTLEYSFKDGFASGNIKSKG
ncbi:hypothetical protein BT63DRAFT_428905, partial [Microthyrium microscopicum]